MLLLLFHQADVNTGANEVPELLPIFGGSLISEGFKQFMEQHFFRCILEYEQKSLLNSH